MPNESGAAVGYEPARIRSLIARARAVADHLGVPPPASAEAADPAAAVRAVAAGIADRLLPALGRIDASRALIDGIALGGGSCRVVPAPTSVIADVVHRLDPTERAYLQGFVDAAAPSVAQELWRFAAHTDYDTSRLPAGLTTLDDDDEWLHLAQLYVVEQYQHLVADHSAAVRYDGEAYWIDPIALQDTTDLVLPDILLAAAMAGGNLRVGGSISRATAHTAASPMPAPRPLDAPDHVTGWSRHAREQARSRDGHGVSDAAVADAVTNPAMVRYDAARDRFRYDGEHAVVVLGRDGSVVTTWARRASGWRFP